MNTMYRFFILSLCLGGLFLFIPHEAQAYKHPFHKKIAKLSIDMKAEKYPFIKQFEDKMLKGSIQPDIDRRKRFWENPRHKHDASRITINYKNAVKRYDKHYRQGRKDYAMSEGLRIMSKTFHFYADQSETRFGRNESFFIRITGLSPRNFANKIINTKPLRRYIIKEARYYERYSNFRPTDKENVRAYISEIKSDLELAIVSIRRYHNPNDPASSRRKIEIAYIEYIAKIVALQNITIDRFVEETKAEEKGSVTGTWETNYGLLTLSKSGNTIIGFYDDTLQDGRVIKKGAEVKDAVLVGNVLKDGYWTNEWSLVKCSKKKYGKKYWGKFKFTFYNEFNRFSGTWGYCDGRLDDTWDGTRKK